MAYTIQPASSFDITDLVTIINASYEDYLVPIHFSPGQLEFFYRAHDVDLDLSTVCVHNGDLIGLAQLARRGMHGWIAGLGVIPAFRRRGIARSLMEKLTMNAKDAGIHQLQLEVLLQNEAAQALYEQLGWEIQRELLTWNRPADADQELKPHHQLSEANPADVLANFFHWHVEAPCWQRQRKTLGFYVGVGLTGWSLTNKHSCSAYILRFPPRNGFQQIMDVAVDPLSDTVRVGRSLMTTFHHHDPDVSTILVNEPMNSSLSRILPSLAYHVTNRQYEMTLALSHI